MHPQSTKNQFVELRAQGLSLGRIAVELEVAPSTLFAWQQELQGEIDNERAFRLELLHEEVCSTYGNELRRLADRLNKIEVILNQREFDDLSTASLLTQANALRTHIRKHLLPAKFTPGPTPDRFTIPPDPACEI